MKSVFATFIALGITVSGYSQTITDHPLKITNQPVEAVEFIIYSTTNLNSSNVPTQTILGHYNRAAANVNQRIVYDHALTHPTAWNTVGSKAMNILTLDLDGDKYDEVIEAHESNQGITIGVPFMQRSPLMTDSLHGNFITTGITVGTDEPRFKLAKGDFRRNGKYYFAIAYRDYTADKINIEIRNVDIVTHFGTQLARIASDSFHAFSGSRIEVFDITINDFDGDSIPDLALCALERTPGGMSCYLRTFKVTPGADVYNGWTITPMGKQTVTPTGTTSDWENIAISSGLYDSTAAPQRQIAVGLAYIDPNDNTKMYTQLYIASTGSGAGGLNTISISGSNYSSRQTFNALPALSIQSGDLNSNANEEIVFASGNNFWIFSVGDNMTVTSKTSASGGGVSNDFYQQANNNSYLSIGDVDLDLENDILMVTAGNDGNTSQWFSVYVFGVDPTLSAVTVKGVDGTFQEVTYSGFSGAYRYAAAFGEFSGGRGILKDPTHFTRKILTPLIVNNGPPYHFDILDSMVADITDCFPNFTCDMNSQYKEVTTTSSTLQTTLKSDWGVSGTLSAGGTVLGVGLKASVTAKYGEEFSNTQMSTTTVQISTLSTAKADDQIYGVVSDYDIYEYPVDSSGITIGYVLAMMRRGNPIVQWMDSKSNDAFGYIPDHEVGNLLSYPPNSEFPTYSGNLATIKPGTGFNVGSGGTLNFSMVFTDFASSSVSETQSFGLEVNASASYYGVSLEAKGTYNSSEMTSHTSTAQTEISYISNLTTPLNPLFSDANYTMTPYVYWAKNGALSLGYSVDPSLPGGGTNNFWSNYYVDKPDLTMIMPWKYDPEKGYSLGTTPDKRRLCKSLSFNKTSFITGDTVLITAYIHNYSFKTYTGDVEFQFYAGDPDNGGMLMADINGQTTISVNGTFPARGRTPIQFHWLVPAGVNPGPRIYLVIDPNNLISEVHEDNNTGFSTLGAGVVTGIEDEKQHSAQVEARVYPNPAADGWAQVELRLPESGKLQSDLLDLQGRVVKELYNSNLRQGNYILPVSLSDVAHGFYFVTISFNESRDVLRVVNVRY
ncbi:MAG TPA: T9SS type A sorting domain-containing protein [Chitinophagales bacterium]|nr:T9SS type A sorting domain-containing protein [Chitinophagales bacterium]